MRVRRRVREVYYNASKRLTLNVDSCDQVMSIILQYIILVKKTGVCELAP